MLLCNIVMSKTRTGPQMRDFPWYAAGNAGLFEQSLGFERLRPLLVSKSGAEISIQLQQRPSFLLESEMCANL